MKHMKGELVCLTTLLLIAVLLMTSLTSVAATSKQNTDLASMEDSVVVARRVDIVQQIEANAPDQEAELPVEHVEIVAPVDDWAGYAMSNVADEADVYREANAESEVAGKIFHNTKVTVVDRQDDWTHIVSGNLDGFIQTEKLIFDRKGELLMKAKCLEIATIKEATPIYTGTDAAQVMSNAQAGTELFIDGRSEGWVKVVCEASEEGIVCGYVPEYLIDSRFELQDGKTVEEIQAEAEAARKAEEAAAAAAAQAAARRAAAQTAAAQQTSSQPSAYSNYYGNASGLNKYSGVNYHNGRKETYYSSRVLHHRNTSNWVVDAEGYYHDPNTGAYIVAASDLPQGTVFQGSKGDCIVLDSGCAAGTTDYYVNW